jgi:hypothetical protein
MINDFRLPTNKNNELRNPEKSKADTGVRYLGCNFANEKGRWCLLAATYTKREVVNVIALTTPRHDAATQHA